MTLTAFDHVNIRTTQLDQMITWYEQILGLSAGFRPDFGFDGAWLYLGEHAVVHLVATDEDITGGGDITLEHVAFRATDKGAFLARLDAKEITYRTGRIEGAGITQINIWDPDGNHIHVDFRDD